MTIFRLPSVKKLTVGTLKDVEREVLPADSVYPAIIISYSDALTCALAMLFRELKVDKKDLVLVNFEEFKDKYNVVVCFRAKRPYNKEWLLGAEAEISREGVADFKRYFEAKKIFIICFGLWAAKEITSLAHLWHIFTDSYTEYDGKSVLKYLCGDYH